MGVEYEGRTPSSDYTLAFVLQHRTITTSPIPCYKNFSTNNTSVILCGPTAKLASQFEVSVLYKVNTDTQILQSCRDFSSITVMAVQSRSNQARDSLGSDRGSSRGRGDEEMKYNHTDRQTDSFITRCGRRLIQAGAAGKRLRNERPILSCLNTFGSG